MTRRQSQTEEILHRARTDGLDAADRLSRFRQVRAVDLLSSSATPQSTTSSDKGSAAGEQQSGYRERI
jgi:hypothetical protein